MPVFKTGAPSPAFPPHLRVTVLGFFACLLVIPPRSFTTAGIFIASPTHTFATLDCPHRVAPPVSSPMRNTTVTMVSPPRETPPWLLSLFPPLGKHHRDHCHCHYLFPMGDTTVTIVSAVKETLLPPDPFHYREEHYSLWDLDWLEINAVNSTLFISISLSPLKSLRLCLAEIPPFHCQLLPPLFLY